jgi:hypothetical protein
MSESKRVTTIYDVPKDVIRYTLFNFMLYHQIKQCYQTAKLFRVLTPHQLRFIQKTKNSTLNSAAEDGDVELFEYLSKMHKLYHRPLRCFWGYSIIASCINNCKEINDNYYTILWELLTRFKRLQIRYTELRNAFHSILKSPNTKLYIQFIQWCLSNGYNFHQQCTDGVYGCTNDDKTITFTLSEVIVDSTLSSSDVNTLKQLHDTFGTDLFPVTQKHFKYVTSRAYIMSEQCVRYITRVYKRQCVN